MVGEFSESGEGEDGESGESVQGTGDDGVDGKSGDDGASGASGVAGVAVGGISLFVLAGIAVAILAPAVIIYWIVRRRTQGFETMPPVATEANTYRAQGVRGNFSIGDE